MANYTDWLLQNSGGSILGKPAAALGVSGSALGIPGPALGAASGMFGGQLAFNKPAFGLTGIPKPEDLTLDKKGKEGMSGMGMANMGVGAANAMGVPQAIFGRTAGSAIGGGAQGALTGMAMGGPVGAGIGGALGLAQGLGQGKAGGKKPYQGPVGTADPNNFYL